MSHSLEIFLAAHRRNSADDQRIEAPDGLKPLPASGFSAVTKTSMSLKTDGFEIVPSWECRNKSYR